MRKTAFLLLMALMLMPVAMFGDSYSKLWKQVDEAVQKDLPKTQIQLLQTIADKAEAGNDYGQLLKAETRMASVWYSISADSLPSQLSRLEDKAEKYSKTDGALSAVYYAALGKIYSSYHNVGMFSAVGIDNSAKSVECYRKAMANPSLLASKKALCYKPFVVEGRDGKYFEDDLLSLIGYTAEDYATMHSYYATTSNRTATLLTALAMVKQNNQRNGGIYFRELKKSRYAVSLDSLINIYSDLKACGEVAVERYLFMEKCSDVKTEDLVTYINNAVCRWGEWPRMNVLRNKLKALTNPQFEISLTNNVVMPGKSNVIKMNIRNIDEIKVKISRIAVDGDTELVPTDENGYKALRKKIVPLTENVLTKRYPGQPEYKMIKDSLVLGGMPIGVYLVEISADDKSLDPQRRLLYVTDMFVVHHQLPGNKLRLAALSATTGQPMPGATIEVLTNAKKTYTLTCDNKGETTLSLLGDGIRKLRAYTERDKAAPLLSTWSNFSYYSQKNDRDVLNLFTDRTIYRPGQTVHVAAVAYNIKNGTESKVIAGKAFKLTMKDANYKTVSEANVTTDEYGTASADFVLPSGGLTGRYTIQSDFGINASVGFSVEEYKRPTFQVEFPKINQRYQNGDTLVVTAHAKTYAGVPVQGAKVRYTVRRSQSMWWRYYAGAYTNGSGTDVLTSGEAVTDSDGAFNIEMPMVLPAWVETDGGIDERTFNSIARFYTITADAEVTDQAGETRSGQLALPLGSKPAALSTTLPERILRDSLKTIKFVYKNMAGVDIDDNVRYYIDGSFNAFNAKTNRDENITWNTASQLRSGRHTLVAICGNDTLKQDFVVFSLDDTKPCVKTHDWFYLSDTRFPSDGRPVYLQVGSSDADTHILYTVISGKEVIANGTTDLSNQLSTRSIAYKEEYGDGLKINLVWVKDGKDYSHSVYITRPVPDKRLMLKWTTFRDRLTPGQSEEWTLNVTKPDGTATGAQLMATLYDSSLDQITPFNWGFYYYVSISEPYTQWRSVYQNGLHFSSVAEIKLLDENSFDMNKFDLDGLFMSMLSSRIFGLTSSMRLNAAGSAVKKQAVAADLARSSDSNSSSTVMSKEELAEPSVSAESSSSQAGSSNNVQLRENLNETAFFYPALQTDAKGNVKIKFTLPESITTWKFMGLAHDKDVNYGLIEGETVARKTVMVQPNMPRFVRVGDRASIAARIFNTSENSAEGTAVMQLVDPETDKTVFEQRKSFKVAAGQTTSVSFEYCPDANSSLLVCKIFANGRNFSDGEQHYLPVLADEELVTNTVPFTLPQPGQKTIDLGGLFAKNGRNSKLTVEYTNNPAWLVLQALPYIGTANENNAISLATAYYANSISNYILNNAPQVKTTFEQWKREAGQTSLMSSLEKNQELKDIVLNETPWVADADNETEQKRLLANYFDSSSLSNNINVMLGKLQKLQNQADGSWSWWQGMPYGSPSLTASIVELLTRLNTMIGIQAETKTMIDKAMTYLGRIVSDEVNDIKKAEKEGKPYVIRDYSALQYLYVCALSNRQLTSAERSATDYLLEYLKTKNTSLNLYGKALMAVVLSKNGDSKLAGEYLKSLEEYSVKTETMGRYYDSPRSGYSWFDYRIPTQVAAIEAMKLVDTKNYSAEINEMRQWLLQQKRVQGWNTPVNSANAVYAFLSGNMSVLDKSENAVIKLDGKQLDMSPATAGLGYVKSATNVSKPGKLTVSKTSEGTSWGAVYAQSVCKTSDVSASSAGFKVTREILSADGSKPSRLKVGSRIKVRITIVADRDYDFVQVSDKRAACMEPLRQLSGYAGGYYCTPKDNVTNYYFDRFSKGTHVIETEYYVDREGTYETGTCTVQCAYSPEYAGRAVSEVIVIE